MGATQSPEKPAADSTSDDDRDDIDTSPRAEFIRRDPPQNLTVQEAAWYLRVSERKVRREIDAGRLTHVRMGGRIIFRLIDLQADVERMLVRGADAP